MVCVYCGEPTGVANSRLQKRDNQVWRRRHCLSCGGIFTTEERAALEKSVMVAKQTRLEPFSRDKLFVSIHDSCKHRPTGLEDAASLTQTIIARALSSQSGGMVPRDDIVHIARQVLARFDKVAATFYTAYHKPTS